MACLEKEEPDQRHGEEQVVEEGLARRKDEERDGADENHLAEHH